MRVGEWRRAAFGAAWQDFSSFISLILFFGVTAMLFRSIEFALVITASLGFHELGHAWALTWFGIRWRIGFGLVGAWTWSPARARARLSQFENALVHLAGPFFSLLLAMIALALYKLWSYEGRHLLILANFSAQAGLLNLLPIGSLTDGGKVFQRTALSLKSDQRPLAVLLPFIVTAGILALYTLAQARFTTPDHYQATLLGLLLIGLWLAGGMFFQTRRSDPLPEEARPMTGKQAFFLILVMWDILVLYLLIIFATPFWLEPQYIEGYVQNLFSILHLVASLL